MDKFGLGGITHNFDIAFIRPLPYIHMALMHAAFGHLSALPYHAWNIVLHGVNAFLVFSLFVTLTKLYAGEEEILKFVGIGAGLLFLILPYQTEAVTWVAATVDLIVTTWVLVSLILFLKHKISGAKKHLYGSAAVFFLALMSKESSIFLPLFIFVIECIEYLPKRNVIQPFKTVLLYACWFPLYIFMRYYFLGELIGGYHEVHTSFHASLIIYNAILYSAKFFVFYRLLPEQLKEVFKLIFHNRIILVASVLVVLGALIYLRHQLKSLVTNKIFLIVSVGFFCSLIPVINLETSFIGDSQSDRYGYLPSIFFCVLFTFMLNRFVNRQVFFVIGLGLAAWFYIGIQKINSNWLAGSAIAEPLIKNFNPPNGIAYIFNLPDNFNGTYMLRTGFGDGVSLIRKKDYSKNIITLAYHPLQSAVDSIHVSRLDSNTFDVELTNIHTRFYFADKLFAHNPNSEKYSILNYSDTNYVVRFKELKKDDQLYYYTSGKLLPLN